ncbi:pre-rrna processing [Trichoderma cornu-damae]|uniref:rRNA biogenesis protein RRP36 n=1 Tax=Trichoderma cornu-damae TaxID=654480 RepID=A0A9P8TVA6_9HYPO|nr:pre-rrna processing [Trichoderma cornu-damae]
MSSKRKYTSSGLERRVRARREEEWESELSASDDDSGEEVSEEEEEEEEEEEGDDEDGDSGEVESGSESEESEEEAKVGLSSVSFGALARAAASLPPSEKKKGIKSDADLDDASTNRATKQSSKREPRKPVQSRAEASKRSSKHAPQEMTSKKPVSRRREILADPRRKARDPRFDALAGKLDEAKIAKNYSFLDEYRESEMAELRMQIKKTKDVAAKEGLKRQLLSMESQKKARKKKEEEAKLLQEHRKKEKELVAQGKQPFYLRKSEQKKQLLMNRYASMSKSQVDKAIERKRKKVASKEKKELASLERVSRRH